jgi:hypothetical protein
LSDNQLINLLQDGPVAIAVSSVNWDLYAGGGLLQCPKGAAINHAVLLIGYTPNYWIIKNQWGTSWGINGFANITRNTDYSCRIGTSAFIMFELNTSISILVLLGLILMLVR